jgi:hypothetical protein
VPNRAESNRVLEREGKNSIWISGEFPATSLTQHEQPFVVGSRSLLEVIRSDDDLQTVGIFYAPFSILDLDLRTYSNLAESFGLLVFLRMRAFLCHG